MRYIEMHRGPAVGQAKCNKIKKRTFERFRRTSERFGRTSERFGRTFEFSNVRLSVT